MMRTFNDAHGDQWQVALMEGSYGDVALMFGRLGGGEVLQRTLAAEAANFAQAEALMAQLDEAGLRAFLAEATVWK